jgi:hypothetical protein
MEVRLRELVISLVGSLYLGLHMTRGWWGQSAGNRGEQRAQVQGKVEQIV